MKLALLAVLASSVVTTACAVASAASDPPPRPVVLLVHGRGQLGLDTSAIRRSWQQALDVGARGIAGEPLLRDGDVRLVWYADALDPLSPDGCTPAARRPAGEEEGLRAFAGIAGAFLAALTDGVEGEGGREMRSLAGDLQFFADARKRCAAEERLGAALERAAREGRPAIVVAHSLGAIVSWGHLQSRGAAGREAPKVERLVTIGSPLGSEGVQRLLFGTAPSFALPDGLASWVNVVNAADPFAAALPGAGGGVTNVVVRGRSGEDAHEAEAYLRTEGGARAVLGAWCAAFGRGAPASCERVRP